MPAPLECGFRALVGQDGLGCPEGARCRIGSLVAVGLYTLGAGLRRGLFGHPPQVVQTAHHRKTGTRATRRAFHSSNRTRSAWRLLARRIAARSPAPRLWHARASEGSAGDFCEITSIQLAFRTSSAPGSPRPATVTSCRTSVGIRIRLYKEARRFRRPIRARAISGEELETTITSRAVLRFGDPLPARQRRNGAERCAGRQTP